jgi:hypothetical protein
MGPEKSGRVSPDVVKRELKEAGYTLAAVHDFLPNQYYLVFQRKHVRIYSTATARGLSASPNRIRRFFPSSRASSRRNTCG